MSRFCWNSRAGRGPGGWPAGSRVKDRFEKPEKLAHLRLADQEWRQETQRVVVRAVDEQSALERRRDERRALDGQLDANHQTFAANFLDYRELSCQCFEPRTNLGASRPNVFEQLFVFDNPQKFERCGAGKRTATASVVRIAPSGSPAASGFAITAISGFAANF